MTQYRFDPDELKRRRVETGMTRELLAVMVGVTKEAVVAWEAGRSAPRAASLGRIAEQLGCDPGDLYMSDDTARDDLQAHMITTRQAQGLPTVLPDDQVAEAVALLRRHVDSGVPTAS